MRVKVAFKNAGNRSFEDCVAELVDTIGVFPDPPSPGNWAPHDLALVGVEEDRYPGLRGTAEFAVPATVLPDDGAIPMIVAIATYGSVYRFLSEYQVVDIEFPSEGMPQADLCGPKFGPELVDADSTTRLGLILKPRFLSSEARLRTLVGAISRAGIDYVSDDELTVSTPELPFERRVMIAVEELAAAERDTGRRVPFIANITGGYSGALRRAKIAEELGAHAVMVNTIAMGYDVVSDVASDASRGIGIIANSIGRGVLTSGPGYRIAPEVLCKLARLAGADGVYAGTFSGAIDTEQHAERFYKALNAPYHRLCARQPAAAVMSGGIGLPEIIENEKLYPGDLFLSMGRDFVRPIDAGIPALVVLECIRSVWAAVRDGGVESGRDAVRELADRGSDYGRCLIAIRAEEAVSR